MNHILPHGGGYPAEAIDLFPHYEDEGGTSPETIAGVADEIQRPASELGTLSGDIDVAHRPAAVATSGELASPIEEAPTAPRGRASVLLATTLCASGSLRLFGEDGVRAYDELVDGLRSDYAERKAEIMASDCGVADVDYPDGATEKERTELDDSRDSEVQTARQERLAELVADLRGRQEELRGDPLDAEAEAAATRLKEGPTDENLKDLFSAGVLPASTVDAFPGITFEYKEIPSDFEDMSKEEIEAYLKEHPEASDMVNELLTKKGELSDTELTVVDVQAEIDADLLKKGLDAEAGDEALEAISAATERLGLINDHIADGGKITDAVTSYTDTWFDDVGAKALTKLSDQVSSSLEVTRHGDIVDPSAMQAYLSPVSDMILNLSNGDNYPSGSGDPGKEYMPEAVQELLGIRIGEATEDYRAGEIDDDGLPHLDKIKNLDMFNGWSDLMAASSVEGGNLFSEDLAEQAIQAKQDMNAIWAWADKESEDGLLSEEEFAYLESHLEDSGSSDLLSVVSRNEDASADLLLDESRRQQLLGMNWDDSEGAADVIRGGTDRDPEDGGGTERQAEAALAVMTEIASDPKEYMDRADSEAVSDAIVDVGITWIDTFGENVSSETESTFTVNDTDVLGRDLALSVTLSNADQEGFLAYVADTDSDAIRFESASQYYGRQLIADALDQDDPDVLDDALEWAGRVEGQIQEANVEWAMDDIEGENDKERAELAAYNRTMAATNATAKVILGAGSTIGGASFPPAAPFLSVGNTLAGPIIDQLLAEEPMPDYESMEEAAAEKQIEEYNLDKAPRRNYLLAQVAVMKGETVPEDLQADDGSLLPLSEIAKLENKGNDLDKLEALGESAIRDWNSRHGTGDHVDLDDFDEARDATFSTNSGGHPETDDGWRDGEDTRKNLYGDNLPGWYGGREEDHLVDEIYEANDDKIGKAALD